MTQLKEALSGGRRGKGGKRRLSGMIPNWETAGVENGSRSFWPPHPLATVVLPHLRTKKISICILFDNSTKENSRSQHLATGYLPFKLLWSCNDEVAVVYTRPQRFSRGDSRRGGRQWPSDQE
jgi:hypothetical protein